MYGTDSLVLASGATSLGAAAGLAQAGVATGWFIVAGVAAITVVIFLLRLLPRDEF